MFTVQYISHVCVCVCVCCALHLNWYLMLWRLKTWREKNPHNQRFRSVSLVHFILHAGILSACVSYMFGGCHLFIYSLAYFTFHYAPSKEILLPLYTHTLKHKQRHTEDAVHLRYPVCFVLLRLCFFLFIVAVIFSLSILMLLLLLLHDWARASF